MLQEFQFARVMDGLVLCGQCCRRLRICATDDLCRNYSGITMAPALGRVVIYTRQIDQMTAFYTHYFGFSVLRSETDRIVELRPQTAGLTILLHPAGSGQREGQVQVKFVFDVEDVEAFREFARADGLEFGKIHRADGYVFANAKDPAKNAIQVSSRAFSTS